MSEKLVKVINNKDRYFNWARKGGILEVAANRVAYYLQNWFSLLEKIEEKKNIVQDNANKQDFPGVDNDITIPKLKEQLDHHGVDYSDFKKKADYQKALSNVLIASNEGSDDNDSNIETLKKQLVDEAIVTADELEGKTDAEIEEIAHNNWF